MEVLRLFEALSLQQEEFPQEVCLAEKQGTEWRTYSTKEVRDIINSLSCYLLDQGITPGDKVAIVSYNCPAWVFADHAILQIGAIDVPMYPNSTTEDYEYIIRHAGIQYVFAGDDDLEQKLKGISGIKVINFKGREFDKMLRYPQERVAELDSLRKKIDTSDVASIIYTSGTTGKPKGVMLTHDNILSNVVSIKEIMIESRALAGSRVLSFLPLCHIFERTGLYLDIYLGYSVYFAESIEKIGDNMREIHPQVLRSVPRLIEKIYEKIIATGHDLTGIKKQLFFWAVKLANTYDIQRKGSLWYRMQLAVADKLILSKWREALGGEVILILSGAASLRPSLVTIFWAAKMPILEGYGLTETSPVVTASRYSVENVRAGCVGYPIENVSIKLDSDGEILVKGPNVMKGYYNQPEETEKVLSNDGWFRTGDIGELVEGKFLKITDRKKEIFKTSGGKYIAPQPIEIKLKESLYVEHAMVVGEFQKFASALLVPVWDQVLAYCKRHSIEADKNNLITHPKVLDLFEREVAKANESFARYEQIKKFRLVEGEWNVDNNMLTPTLKLKRRMIFKEYSHVIDDIYTRDPAVTDNTLA